MLTLDEVRASHSAVITIKDAATLLACNPRTVTAALSIHGGDIPSRRVGRRVVIPRSPFLAWLEGEPEPDPIEAQSSAPDATALIRAKLIELLGALEGAI